MAKGKPLTEAEKKKRNEQRAAKFKELGTKRLNNALASIRKLEPLANKNGYVYTDEQVSKMIGALEEHTKRIKQVFSGGTVASTGVEL
jgi:hypothetical protein